MEGLAFVTFVGSVVGFGASLIMGDFLAAAFAFSSMLGWGFVWVAFKEKF